MACPLCVQVGDINEVVQKADKMAKDIAARKARDSGTEKAKDELKDVPPLEKLAVSQLRIMCSSQSGGSQHAAAAVHMACVVAVCKGITHCLEAAMRAKHVPVQDRVSFGSATCCAVVGLDGATSVRTLYCVTRSCAHCCVVHSSSCPLLASALPKCNEVDL